MMVLVFALLGISLHADLVPTPRIHQKALEDKNLAYLYSYLPSESEKEIEMRSYPKEVSKKVLRRIKRNFDEKTSEQKKRYPAETAIVCYKEEVHPRRKFGYDTKYFCHEIHGENIKLPEADAELAMLVESDRKQK